MTGTGLLGCRGKYLPGAVALLALGCVAAQCQSLKGTLTSGSQSASADSGQGPANSGGASGNLLGASSVMAQGSTQNAGAARKLNRIMTSRSAGPSAENFCFQPGVGWVIVHGNTVTGTHAFQTIPVSVGVAALAAQRMPQSPDPNECDANAGGSSGFQAAGAPGSDMELPESNGAAGEGKPSQSQQSGGTPQAQESETATGSTVQSDNGGVTYSFGPEQPSQSVSIRTSITRNGGVVMSVVPPEMAITQTVESAELLEGRGQGSTPLDDAINAFGGQSLAIRSFAFVPGQPESGESINAESAEGNGRVSQDRIAEAQRHVIGREPQSLKRQENRAASGDTVSPAGMHAYMRIHKACTRLEDQISSAGGNLSASGASLGGVTSREASEVGLLRKGCVQFLRMDKAAALRYLDKHRGLE